MAFQWVLNLGEKLSDSYSLDNINDNEFLLKKRKSFMDLIVGLKTTDAFHAIILFVEKVFKTRPVMYLIDDFDSVPHKTGDHYSGDPLAKELVEKMIEVTEGLSKDEIIIITNNIYFKNALVVDDKNQLK